MSHEFELKPLSSGIGLGSLKPSKPKSPKPIQKQEGQSPDLIANQIAKRMNAHLEINPTKDRSDFAHSRTVTSSAHSKSEFLPPVPTNNEQQLNIAKSRAASTNQQEYFVEPGLDLNQRSDQSSKSAGQDEFYTQPIQSSHLAGRQAYNQHSVGKQIRASGSGRFLIWSAKALVGWVLDLFVVSFTVVVASIFGSFAWKLGQGAEDRGDLVAAISQIVELIAKVGPLSTAGVFVGCYLVYVIAMKIVVGSTIGGSLREP